MMTSTAIETALDFSVTYFAVKAGYKMDKIIRDALDQARLTSTDVGIILPDGTTRLITEKGELTAPMRQYLDIVKPDSQPRLMHDQRDSHLYLG